jgi:hypothetical protein
MMIPETVYAMARGIAAKAGINDPVCVSMIAQGINAERQRCVTVVNLIKPVTRREGLIIGNTVRRINDGVTP